jgi:trehalose-phosphatase
MVATDYDGTLTPIADHPDLAGLDPRTRRVLARLARLPGVEMAILSARPLAAVRGLVRVSDIHYSGLVGLETQSAGGPLETHLTRGHELPAELKAVLLPWCERFEGAWIEDKRLTLALHYRDVAPRSQVSFAAGVRARLKPYENRLQVVPGKKVLEILPRGKWNKAVALARWWTRMRGGALIFLGDDENDEPVHAYVREQDGIAIAVGRRESRAEYALATSEEVRWWLEWLEREWSARKRLAEQDGTGRER